MAETVRVGETEDVVFRLTRDKNKFDLTDITSATLRRRSSWDEDDSTDTLTGLLTVSTAAAGEITLSPNAAFWAHEGYYDVYIDVVLAGSTFTFPRAGKYDPIGYIRFTVVPKYS